MGLLEVTLRCRKADPALLATAKHAELSWHPSSDRPRRVPGATT